MYKIMLIDDFSSDLEVLQHILDELSNVQIIAVCSNGKEALEQIPELMPDIIISDIEMPIMNGFDLARFVKSDYPDIKIIFCSFHNEFEFVQQALYLDGYGYVLKPVNSEELSKCILDVMSEIGALNAKRNESIRIRDILETNRPLIADNFVRELICGMSKDFDDIWERADYYDLNIRKGFYYIVLIEIDDYQKITARYSIEQKQILVNHIYKKLKDHIDLLSNGVLTRIDDSHFALLYSFSYEKNMDEAYEQILNECARILIEYKKSDIGLTLALSNQAESIEKLCYLYENCTYTLSYKYLFGKGTIIKFKDIPYTASIPTIDYNRYKKEIRFLLNSGKENEFHEYIDGAMSNLTTYNHPDSIRDFLFYITICIQSILHEHKESFRSMLGEEITVWQQLLNFETVEDAQAWIIELMIKVNEYISSKTKQSNDLLCDKVIKYINENYTRDMNIDMLASEFHYNPDYLNHVFKENTGTTIYSYLCQFKVDQAKELLSNTSLKLYEIADRLGFSHTAYFGNFFKKYTGLTPKEYRGYADD